MDTDFQRRFPSHASLLTGFGWLWLVYASEYLTDAACNFVTFFFASWRAGLAIGCTRG